MSSFLEGQAASVGRRAPRFPIQTRLLYRVDEDPAWHEARTENISRTGILFFAGGPMDGSRALEMKFALPVEIHGHAAAEVLCSGRVVRVIRRGAESSPVGIGASILSYEILKGLGTGPA